MGPACPQRAPLHPPAAPLVPQCHCSTALHSLLYWCTAVPLYTQVRGMAADGSAEAALGFLVDSWLHKLVERVSDTCDTMSSYWFGRLQDGIV